MIHTENFEGIKLDIQTVDMTIKEDVRDQVYKMIRRLRRIANEISYVDINFKKESGHSTNDKSVSVRLGIPGNDAFANDSGDHWLAVLSSVEDKLRSQLEKRKTANERF
jgi:ribosomal subunit interface protein